MLRKFVVVSALALPPLLGAGVARATPPPSPCAALLEGYGGMSMMSHGGADSPNANAGGTGSVGCLFGIFHVQGDVVGDWNDMDHIGGVQTDSFSNVGGGGSLGVADPSLGALEVNGMFNHVMVDENLGDNDVWRIGGLGEYYWNPLTAGVYAGYLKSNSGFIGSGSGYYARGMLRYYPTEDIKLEGSGGVGEVDGHTIPQASLLAEWRPATWPVGFFIRGEGAWHNSNALDLNQYFYTGGIRVYLFDKPATLRETDRRYFRPACLSFLIGTRTC